MTTDYQLNLFNPSFFRIAFLQSINLSAISVSHTQEEIRFRWWPASLLNQEEEREAGDTIIGSRNTIHSVQDSTGSKHDFWPSKDCANMAHFGKKGK